MEKCAFLCFHVILNMKAQKHACFHVNFPFSTNFYPLPKYIIMVNAQWLSNHVTDYKFYFQSGSFTRAGPVFPPEACLARRPL